MHSPYGPHIRIVEMFNCPSCKREHHHAWPLAFATIAGADAFLADQIRN